VWNSDPKKKSYRTKNKEDRIVVSLGYIIKEN
jgi:hypothetical protein